MGLHAILLDSGESDLISRLTRPDPVRYHHRWGPSVRKHTDSRGTRGKAMRFHSRISWRHYGLAGGAGFMVACSAVGQVHGPDIIVGIVEFVNDYARAGDTAALAFSTTSCNVGDQPIDWSPLPSNRHPVIAQNMYRLKDGRLEQIGQAWVKHGFAALQLQACFTDCIRSPTQTRLGVHCSDPYAEQLNRGPELGARSEVNPVTGFFDGRTADQHHDHVHSLISHGLQVTHSNLGNPGARYFVEAQYIAADDALAGHGNNNVSYREVLVGGTGANWQFLNVGTTIREQPAVRVWPEADFEVLDTWPEDGRIIVASKVTDFGGAYRYDYAIYNMNSERGIASFSLPVGSAELIPGFSAPLSHDEPYSNDPWDETLGGGAFTWSTAPYSEESDSNPIRWGTMYNFWFDTDTAPQMSYATLGRYKPGNGPDYLRVRVPVPASGDCNGNLISDDVDIFTHTSNDDNEDGIPDECVFCYQSDDCGVLTRCKEHICPAGWCEYRRPLYGDADDDGFVRRTDFDCVIEGFAFPADCPRADLFPCQPDGDVTMDDMLAAFEAFRGRFDCCAP